AGVVVSKTIRCFPGILSIQSSCAWRAGLKPADDDCAEATDVPDASAAPATVTPAPRWVRNDRRSLAISTLAQHGNTRANIRDDDPCTRLRDNSGSGRTSNNVRCLPTGARAEDLERRPPACGRAGSCVDDHGDGVGHSRQSAGRWI